MSTRRSRAIATSILRIVAACCASFESNCSRSSLVTPSTMAGDLGAEGGLDVGDGDLGVLDRVVQQRGRERDLVEADVGDDAGHRQRMVDVALAAASRLVAVRFLGGLVGAVDHRHRRLRVPAAVRAEQRRQLVSGDVLVPSPGKHTIDGSHGEVLST